MTPSSNWLMRRCAIPLCARLGRDVIMLLALALHLDPVYVGAHHLTRIFYVSVTMPLVARRNARQLKRAAAASKPPRRLR